MIAVYAEKQDMGMRFAAALGGIRHKGLLVTTNELPNYQDEIKKEISKVGYIMTSYEGKEYCITWGWGHFGTLKDIKDYEPRYTKWRDIPLPYIPEKFEIKRSENKNPDPNTRKFFNERNDRQFEIIKEIFNSDKCEYIINATDWEREGELIFDYVYELTGTNKPYKRLRNNAKTEEQIRKDFKNTVSAIDNEPYIIAARARSIADWTVGINMTIAGTLYLSSYEEGILNIGRVVTPTLNILVDREKKIQNFKPKTNYGIEGTFVLTDSSRYTGRFEQDELFETKKEAEDFLKTLTPRGEIISVEKKKTKTKPPLLYNTSTLQADAENIYGLSTADTLNIAQKLYENGYTTYPRVDSEYLTEDKKSEMSDIINNLLSLKVYAPYKDKIGNMPNRYFDNSKVEGHDAIITTNVLPKDLSKEESLVYNLIARRMLAACMPDIVTEKVTVITEVETKDNEKVTFKTNYSKVTDEGFSAIKVKKKESGTVKDELPSNLRKGIKTLSKFSVYEKTSTPPPRFTESSLIHEMETCAKKADDEISKEYLKKSKGIGRPSTRTAIIEKMFSSGYITKKKNSLYVTSKGLSTIERIPIKDIKSPIMTAKWEEELDNIERAENGTIAKEKCKAFLSDINSTVTDWCHETEKNKITINNMSGYKQESLDIRCCVCDGDVYSLKYNYKCDRCGLSLNKNISGKTITDDIAKDVFKTGRSKTLENFKSKKGKTFSAQIVIRKGFECISCGKLQSNGDKCYVCGNMLRETNRYITTFENVKVNK